MKFFNGYPSNYFSPRASRSISVKVVVVLVVVVVVVVLVLVVVIYSKSVYQRRKFSSFSH